MKELTLKEKHAIILDIMKDVDKFCRENGIRYALSDGTMLGAVRHGGFIPWDDDADICMLREDFDKFVKTYKSDKYHLLYNTRNDEEFFCGCYAKVSDPGTYIINPKDITEYGVFIDIFPLDNVPEDEKEQKKFMHSILSAHNRLFHRQQRDFISILKSYRHSIDWWWKKVDGLTHSGKYDSSPLVAPIVGWHNYSPIILEKSIFDDLKDYDFEGYKFLGFGDSHGYMVTCFGEDYMTPKKWAHNYVAYKKDSQ